MSILKGLSPTGELAAGIAFGIAGFCTLLVVGASQCGCAWWSSHGPAVTADAEKVVLCVLEHSTEPPLQIAVDCGGVELALVTDILAAHRAAAKREAAAVKP